MTIALLGASSSGALGGIGASTQAINALSDRSAHQISDVLLTSELQRRMQTETLVEQARVSLAYELDDVDGDNTREAPAMRASIAGYTPPVAGGFLPVSSMAPKTDGYRMPLGYCVWDNGTSTSSVNRSVGDNPVANASMSFVVLSSGQNRVFDTSCANARSGGVSGDDVVGHVSVGVGNLGISTNAYIGRPVADQAALLALDTSNVEPGEIRMVLNEGVPYSWLDLDGDGTFQWEPAGAKSHFYAGDSNGGSAGGEYSSTPFSVGIGPKFSDQSVVPNSALEVDGRVRIVSDTKMVSDSFGAQLHVGSQVAVSGTAGEVNRIAVQPYGHSGGPFGIVARDDATYAYLDFRYGSAPTPDSSILTIRSQGGSFAYGRVGVGSINPLSRLAVGGPEDSLGGPILTLHGTNPNQFESGRIRFTEHGSDFQGAFIHYEGNTVTGGSLNIGVHKVDGSTSVANDTNVITIPRTTGNVGLNHATPTEALHIRSPNGPNSDTVVLIEADSDNAGSEEDNPRLVLRQDAGGVEAVFGQTGSLDVEYVGALVNSAYVESSFNPLQLVTGNTARMTILPDGSVGVGTSQPNGLVHLSKRTGNAGKYQVLLNEDRSTEATPQMFHLKGVGFSGNSEILAEIGAYGTMTGPSTSNLNYFFINADKAEIAAGSTHMSPDFVIQPDGNIGIGTSTPGAKLDVAGTAMVDRLEVGDAGGNAEFCLNGVCTQEVRTVRKGYVTLSDTAYTPIVYVEGTELGSSIELQINGTTTNKVVNVRADIVAGHDNEYIIESVSPGYTQLDLKLEINGGDEYIVYGKLRGTTGSLSVDVKVTPKNNEVIVLNPTNTITVESDLVHYTYEGSSNVSSGESISMRNNGQAVANITGRNVKVVAPENLAPGWYTIATNPGDRAVARFAVRDTMSSRHQGTVFYASHFFGSGSGINVLSNTHYASVQTFTGLRVVEGSTYDGAMLQVLVGGAGSNRLEAYLLGDNFQANGWSLANWVPDGVNPGGVNNFAALTNVDAKVHLSVLPKGSMLSSGGLVIPQNETWGQGRSFSNSNTGPGIVLGGSVSEKFRIFSQGVYSSTSSDVTECGGTFNDCYIFEMTDSNSANPDGSVIFGATGNDNVFEDYLTIEGNGRVTVSPSDAAGLGGLNSAFSVQTIHGRATMGARNGTYFHLDSSSTSGFYFYDRVTSAVGFTTASDRRFKKNIKDIGGALESLKRIRGVTYDWRLDEFGDRGFKDGKQYGVIAQELKSVFPEMVQNNDDGYLTVNYQDLIPVLVQASNELNNKVTEVEEKTDDNTKRIVSLEKEVSFYKDKVARLEKNLEGGKTVTTLEDTDVEMSDGDIDIVEKIDLSKGPLNNGKLRDDSALSKFYQ